MYVLVDRDWAGAAHFLAALTLLAAALGLLSVSLGSSPGDRQNAVLVSEAPVTTPAAVAVRREVAGRPFSVAGASFEVDPSPGASWARDARAEAPEPGRRWVAAAVAVVNHGRQGFNPGLLSYLLRGPGGALFAPTRAGIVGPDALGRAAGLPPGARAEERLLFSVPAAMRDPVLAIQPAPTRPLEVRVPLGHG